MAKISEQKLKDLKAAVKGSLAKVSELANVSISTTSNVLAGKTNNDNVIRAAIKVRAMLIEERNHLENQI